MSTDLNTGTSLFDSHAAIDAALTKLEQPRAHWRRESDHRRRCADHELRCHRLGSRAHPRRQAHPSCGHICQNDEHGCAAAQPGGRHRQGSAR